MMDIVDSAARLLSEKLGISLDADSVSSALRGLLAGDNGQLDLAGLAGRMASSGDLGGILGSWLGDGPNDAISPDSIRAMFGSDRIATFARQLGIDASTAAGGLAEVLPDIVDKSSRGGSLLDMAGGAEGLLGAARGFFK